MIERKFISLAKEELGVKEFVKKELGGKGKIASVRIEYTPIGEKIEVHTSKPGLIIGKKGEKVNELTNVLKKKFGLENPHLEIVGIENPDLDSATVADEIAMMLEKFGPLSFKIIANRMLERIKKAGAIGAEIRLSGKLPSERARSWRFSFGYLKKTGDVAKIVDRTKTTAYTIPGAIGIKVSILTQKKSEGIEIEKMKEIKEKGKEEKEEVGEKKEKEKKEEKGKEEKREEKGEEKREGKEGKRGKKGKEKEREEKKEKKEEEKEK